MDANYGRFVSEEQAEPHMERLEVGENFKIKGVEFEVLEICEDGQIVAKMLSAADRRGKAIESFFSDVPIVDSIEKLRSKRLDDRRAHLEDGRITFQPRTRESDKRRSQRPKFSRTGRVR